jgi:hypothetical protein
MAIAGGALAGVDALALVVLAVPKAALVVPAGGSSVDDDGQPRTGPRSPGGRFAFEEATRIRHHPRTA